FRSFLIKLVVSWTACTECARRFSKAKKSYLRFSSKLTRSPIMLIVIPTHFHTTAKPLLEPMVRLLMADCLFDHGLVVRTSGQPRGHSPDRARIGGWARRQ